MRAHVFEIKGWKTFRVMSGNYQKRRPSLAFHVFLHSSRWKNFPLASEDQIVLKKVQSAFD